MYNVKQEFISQLKTMLEEANLADTKLNDLETIHCNDKSDSLYHYAKNALIALGEKNAVEYWIESGEWK